MYTRVKLECGGLYFKMFIAITLLRTTNFIISTYLISSTYPVTEIQLLCCLYEHWLYIVENNFICYLHQYQIKECVKKSQTLSLKKKQDKNTQSYVIELNIFNYISKCVKFYFYKKSRDFFPY